MKINNLKELNQSLKLARPHVSLVKGVKIRLVLNNKKQELTRNTIVKLATALEKDTPSIKEFNQIFQSLELKSDQIIKSKNPFYRLIIKIKQLFGNSRFKRTEHFPLKTPIEPIPALIPAHKPQALFPRAPSPSSREELPEETIPIFSTQSLEIKPIVQIPEEPSQDPKEDSNDFVMIPVDELQKLPTKLDTIDPEETSEFAEDLTAGVIYSGNKHEKAPSPMEDMPIPAISQNTMIDQIKKTIFGLFSYNISKKDILNKSSADKDRGVQLFKTYEYMQFLSGMFFPNKLFYIEKPRAFINHRKDPQKSIDRPQRNEKLSEEYIKMRDEIIDYLFSGNPLEGVIWKTGEGHGQVLHFKPKKYNDVQ